MKVLVVQLVCVVLWVQCSVEVEDVRPREIQLSGVKSHVVEGSDISLKCQVFGNEPEVTITWFNSSDPIHDSDDESITIITKNKIESDGTFKTTSQLIFTASRFDHDATFRCDADNDVMRDNGEEPLSESLELQVMYEPVVTIKSENFLINETSDFTLHCESDSNPSITNIKWLHNNLDLKEDESRYEIGTSSLLVKNATRNDSGNYTCEATNIIGKGTSTSEVNMLYKPLVKLVFDPESPVTESVETNVLLSCNIVEANPPNLLEIEWLLNGTSLNIKETDEYDENSTELKENEYLLKQVDRNSEGHYSCRGLNEAGWSDESEPQFLEVYYPPGQAKITQIYPETGLPMKGKTLKLKCSVEDPGNPDALGMFNWFRDSQLIKDVNAEELLIDPVNLESRNNFSCHAFNDAGAGEMARILIDVQAAPAFIRKLPPYTGILYSSSHFMMSCRVECYPQCSVIWFRDGLEIDLNDDKYSVNESFLPADFSTGDFESFLSELHFNVSAWPNQQLDKADDPHEYSCSSSAELSNRVKSTTTLHVEYPPENITITPGKVQVLEGESLPDLFCNASGNPVPKVQLKVIAADEKLSESHILTYDKPMNRANPIVLSCSAENKHGESSANVVVDILYAPECSIEIVIEDERETALVCEAVGNPKEYQYEWKYKSIGDSNVKEVSDDFENRDGKSYLTLDEGSKGREFLCQARNNVGLGSNCAIPIQEDKVLLDEMNIKLFNQPEENAETDSFAENFGNSTDSKWYNKLWPPTPQSFLASCIVFVIVMVCIIFLYERRSIRNIEMEK